jgi:hypothetical protein
MICAHASAAVGIFSFLKLFTFIDLFLFFHLALCIFIGFLNMRCLSRLHGAMRMMGRLQPECPNYQGLTGTQRRQPAHKPPWAGKALVIVHKKTSGAIRRHCFAFFYCIVSLFPPSETGGLCLAKQLTINSTHNHLRWYR